MLKRNKVCLFACILVFSSAVIPVASMTNKNMSRATVNGADVPIWDIGDEWTYHYTESMTFGLNYTLSGDITFKVVDETGGSYVLEGKSRPHGGFFLSDLFAGTDSILKKLILKTTVFTTLTMKLQIRKSDLGLESFNERIKGIFLVKIGPITLPLPIQAEKYMDVEFDPTWKIMPFPVYDGKYGNLTSTEIYFNDLFINMFWGRVPVDGPYKDLTFIVTPLPYTCSSEQIKVDAGTFDVFKVSAEREDDYRFVSYYSEEVGNVVKEEICKCFAGGTVWHSLILELTDWNYKQLIGE